MVSADENRLLTESGPGTPGGDVLRRYWQPAALTEELDSDRPVVPVRLLGEDLVLFRDDQGRLGMIGRQCPHRGVDLSYGRVEDGGLRCPFHGWLFDVTGACLETPAEPPTSTFHTRVCQVHYPVTECNGIVWAFLGEGDPPELPGLDCFVAPGRAGVRVQGHVGVQLAAGSRGRHRPGACGVLASLPRRGGRHVWAAVPRHHRGHRRDRRRADAGGLRAGHHHRAHPIRVPVPDAAPVPRRVHPCADLELHLPQRDHDRDEPGDEHLPVACAHRRSPLLLVFDVRQLRRTGRCRGDASPAHQPGHPAGLPPDRRQSNNWGFDPVEQRERTYTGMGADINVHDQWAVESPGPIFDRTAEHLSPTDAGIRAHRRMFLAALRQPDADTLIGAVDPGVLRGPGAIDGVTTGDDFDAAWRDLETKRREASGWAPALAD